MEERGERFEGEELLVPGILNERDMASILGVSVQTVRRYLSEGKIPAYRVVPGKYLISTEQLIEKIKSEAGSK